MRSGRFDREADGPTGRVAGETKRARGGPGAARRPAAGRRGARRRAGRDRRPIDRGSASGTITLRSRRRHRASRSGRAGRPCGRRPWRRRRRAGVPLVSRSMELSAARAGPTARWPPLGIGPTIPAGSPASRSARREGPVPSGHRERGGPRLGRRLVAPDRVLGICRAGRPGPDPPPSAAGPVPRGDSPAGAPGSVGSATCRRPLTAAGTAAGQAVGPATPLRTRAHFPRPRAALTALRGRLRPGPGRSRPGAGPLRPAPRGGVPTWGAWPWGVIPWRSS